MKLKAFFTAKFCKYSTFLEQFLIVEDTGSGADKVLLSQWKADAIGNARDITLWEGLLVCVLISSKISQCRKTNKPFDVRPKIGQSPSSWLTLAFSSLPQL